MAWQMDRQTDRRRVWDMSHLLRNYPPYQYNNNISINCTPGCTNPNTYEPTIALLSRMTLQLDFPVVDPGQSHAFPMNVIALLPYLVMNYEDANDLCITSAKVWVG